MSSRPQEQKQHDAESQPIALNFVSKRLAESILAHQRTSRLDAPPLPDRAAVLDIVERLLWLMFPGYTSPRDLTKSDLQRHVRAVLEDVAARLIEQVAAALRFHASEGRAASPTSSNTIDESARTLVGQFLQDLPSIRADLSLDVQAALDGDPATRFTHEIILCYPGLHALAVHRLAHSLHVLGVPLIARMMAESAHSATGIDIHPGARIGTSFFIDHGTGVVIGETSVIGDHCTLYQGVTLGAKSFPKDDQGGFLRNVKRHPTLEDHVIVYANATILGGHTVIGAGCVINGGVLVTTSIPPGHVVRGGKIDITLRSNPDMPPANYAI